MQFMMIHKITRTDCGFIKRTSKYEKKLVLGGPYVEFSSNKISANADLITHLQLAKTINQLYICGLQCRKIVHFWLFGTAGALNYQNRFIML